MGCKLLAPKALAISWPFIYLLIVSRAGHAQETARFAPGDIPQVISALLFIEGPLSRRVPLRASESFKLNNTDRVRDFVKQDFQIRVFRVNQGQDVPGYWATYRFTDGDWCDVFLSNVYRYSGDSTGGSGYLPLPIFGDLAWLTPSPSKLDDGHYIFVFERSQDHGEILRLRRSNSQAYFRSGLRVTIEAVGRFSAKDLADVRTYLDKNRKDLEPRIRENSGSIRCYRAKIPVASDKETNLSVALIGDCPTDFDVEESTEMGG